jgi:hypothetical protein
LANPESLTELLRIPSLRSVCFHRFYFTRALCHTMANAFMKCTGDTKFEFIECSFPDGECATMLGNGYSRNSSVSCIAVTSPFDEVLIGALSAALPSNSTLQELSFGVLVYDDDPGARVFWPPICFALRKNESLYKAIQNGLGTNVTLEHLKLKQVGVSSLCGARRFHFSAPTRLSSP